MKRETMLTIVVALLAIAVSAWAIQKRQAGMTTPIKLKSGKMYSVGSAYDQAGY